MIKPLIWKEFCEQRWKMAFGTTMLLFFTGALLAAGVASNNEIVLIIWLFGGLLLALYSAMGVFAPERTDRTVTFLISKPIAIWKVFACKWFFGWLNFVVPMLVCTVCLQFVALKWPGIHIVRSLLGSIGVATMFYSMICCFAPRKSSEAFVGFVGLIVFLLTITHFAIVDFVFGSLVLYQESPTFLSKVISYINPGYGIPLLVTGVYSEDGYLFVAIQTILLVFVMWVGLRKWQRSI